MFRFEDPLYLYLLLLVPALAGLHYATNYFRKKRLARYGDIRLLKELMPEVSVARREVKMWLMLLAFAMLVCALARPQFGTKEETLKRQGIEAIIAMDVSNSMMAEDYSPNRLERAKLAISSLVDKLRDDRIGLVVFAGTSFVQLPVTTDYASAKMFLNSIDTGSIPIQGTALGDALMTCIRSFSTQSERSRAIIVITDGENHEDDPVAVARQAAEMGIKVFAIGVGSPEGKPIPYEGELLKDKDGNIVVSRLDEKVLREIASAGKGAYVHAGMSEFGLNPIVDDIKRMDDEMFNSVVFEEFDEQYMYFFAIALVLLVVEMLVGERKARRHLLK